MPSPTVLEVVHPLAVSLVAQEGSTSNTFFFKGPLMHNFRGSKVPPRNVSETQHMGGLASSWTLYLACHGYCRHPSQQNSCYLPSGCQCGSEQKWEHEKEGERETDMFKNQNNGGDEIPTAKPSS